MRSYSCPPLEAALSISNVSSLHEGQFFGKGFIQINKLSLMSNIKFYESVYLEEIVLVVQQIVMAQADIIILI
jgi:hypothetical protein